MRKRAVIFAGIIALAPLLSAQSQPATSQSSTDTSYVTCAGKPLASRSVRSEVLVSPDGKRRAYAEVEATALQPEKTPGYSGPTCVNNSRLFLAEGSGFKLGFLQEPADTEPGNSLRLVDWSADSRRLLFELAQWQYESPGVTRIPVIYDASAHVFEQPDLARAFNKHFGMDCSLAVRVAGFSQEGKVVIATEPLSPEEEEVLAATTCSRKKSSWVVNMTSETIAPFPEAGKLPHYARSEPAPKD